MMRDLRKFNVSPSLFDRSFLFLWQVIIAVSFAQNYLVLRISADQGLSQRRDEHATPQYKYSYHVRNLEGGQHGHHVLRNGLHTEGKYYVKLNDGASQNVEYYTDQFGYHPKVVYSNNLESGSSGARLAFGAAVNNFKNLEPNKNYPPSQPPNVDTTRADETPTERYSPAPPTEIISSSPSSVTYSTQPTTNEQVASEDYRTLILPLSSQNITYGRELMGNREEMDFSSAPAIESVGGPILLAHSPAADAYLHPEMNEIANGFLGKIVSVVPGMIQAPSRLLKPIIVSDGTNLTRQLYYGNDSSDLKFDQAMEPAQLYEFREIPPDNDLKADVKNDTAEPNNFRYENVITEEKKPSNSNVEVDIEPQMVEEQAVITTTVDISKSLPLAVNFVPEVDNQLNEMLSVNANPPPNLPPTGQQVHILPHPNMFIAPGPQPALQNVFTDPRFIHLANVQARLQQPIANAPVFPFHYIPLPVLQHQPNLIPLNFPKGGLNINPESPAESGNFSQIPSAAYTQEQGRIIENSVPRKEFHSTEIPATVFQPPEIPERKLVKYRSIVNQPAYQQQSPYLRRPFPVPYAVNVSAAHLIPYVRQITNSPNIAQTHPYAQYLSRQQRGGPDASVPVVPHSIAYNVKFFPRDNRKAHQKSAAPFKPSHPLWDSIYPPSHMYYVPYYVVDKLPGDRKARDSSSKRSNRHLRRLYVEYGGFKPPMIPSTLLEEDSSTDKTEVPKAAHESS